MIGDIAHVCNRGIEKRKIFNDSQDYLRFVENLYFLNNRKGKIYTEKKNLFLKPPLLPKQDKLVEVLKWTVLSNHYHLLLYEVVDGGILEYIKRVGNAYTKYFNTKNKNRSGYLFQNSAKIIRLREDPHFLYIPYYIDNNIFDVYRGGKSKKELFNFAVNYRWASLKDYFGTAEHLPLINQGLFYELFDSNPEKYKKELLDLVNSSTCQVEEFGFKD